jgi:hypothetical protein
MEMHFDKATNINVVMWKCGNVKIQGRMIMYTEKSAKPLISFTFEASFTLFFDRYGPDIRTD